MASLFPTEVDLGAITSQVEQLAQLLSEVAAERYVCIPCDRRTSIIYHEATH